MVLRQAWRNLLASKLRLFLTSLAVVLGVGFVVGSFVLGDTINRAFDDVFTAANKNVAVQVRGKATVSEQDRKSVPAGLLPRIRAVDGVKSAEGAYFGTAEIIGKDGKSAGLSGPPALGFSWTDNPDLNPLTIVQGAPPRAADEVVIDEVTVKRAGFAIGDRVRIITASGSATFRLSGIARFGSSGSVAGATLAVFARQSAGRLFQSEDRFVEVDVTAEPGVTQATLASRINAVLPAGYEAVTGTQATKEASDQFKVFVDIFRDALLVFAGIALFVGAFIIFNAFKITVAQRTRQVGLLRAVGASQRQVVGSVLVEAVLIGIIASVIGILFGIGVAALLRAVFNALDFNLPSTTLQIAPRSIIAGAVIGTLVTVVAAIGPAVRAARVPPIAALRDIQVHSSSVIRGVLSFGLTAIGVAVVLGGLFSDLPGAARFSVLGLGAVLLFIGASMLTQYVARPLASVIGRPMQAVGGVAGRIGRENAMRNPQRTAQTASALTIGVALVAGVSVFAASLYQTFAGTIDDRIRSQVVITSTSQQPFSAAAADALATSPDLRSVTGWSDGQFKDAAGDVQALSGVDPANLVAVYDPQVTSGAITDLSRPGTVAVATSYANDKKLAIGDRIDVLFAKAGRKPLTVVAVYDDTTFGQFFISRQEFARDFETQQDTVLLARGREGMSDAQVKTAAEAALSAFPNLEVRTKAEYKDFVSGQINQFLYLFYMLLALAIIIATFGIVLTLALSVFERTREIGLLRAVGLARRSTRAMIRWEAIIVSLIGAVVGLVMGVFLGVVAVEAVPDLTAMSIPWGRLVVFLVLAGVIGVLAAILPAWRASRLNVLEAIQAE